MKKLIPKFFVALFTFSIGIALSIVWMHYQSQPLMVSNIETESEAVAKLSQNNVSYMSGGIQSPEKSRYPIVSNCAPTKSIFKPVPIYPAKAKDEGISGNVTVVVTADETGKVIEAEALTGHELLKQAAVEAAYRAEFEPTTLGGHAVKIKGTLTYKFILP